MFSTAITLQPFPITSHALCSFSECTPHSQRCQSINYQRRAYCCVLSHSGHKDASWHFWEGHFSKSKSIWEWHPVKGQGITWDIQLTLAQKVIVCQVHAALWCLAWYMPLAATALGFYARPIVAMWLCIPGFDTCTQLASTVSEAEHRCLLTIDTPCAWHILALKCAFVWGLHIMSKMCLHHNISMHNINISV